jgi:hypothetical protein
MVNRLRAFCAVRPVGGKFAHRRTDGPAGSSPSMKWVNPPVAQMMHAGAPRLLRAGVHLPGLEVAGDPRRVALEGYPGLVARSLIGRASYKSDDRKRQSAEHAVQRARMVEALERGAVDAQALASSPALASAGASRRCASSRIRARASPAARSARASALPGRRQRRCARRGAVCRARRLGLAAPRQRLGTARRSRSAGRLDRRRVAGRQSVIGRTPSVIRRRTPRRRRSGGRSRRTRGAGRAVRRRRKSAPGAGCRGRRIGDAHPSGGRARRGCR